MKAFRVLMMVALISCVCLNLSYAAQPVNQDNAYSSVYTLACDYLFAVRDKDTAQILKLCNLQIDKNRITESNSAATSKINDFFNTLKYDKSQQLVIHFETTQVPTGETIYKSISGKRLTKEEWEEEGNKIFDELSKKYGFEEIQQKADWTKGPVSDEALSRESEMLDKIWDEQDKIQIDPESEMKTIVKVTYSKGNTSRVIRIRNNNGLFTIDSN